MKGNYNHFNVNYCEVRILTVILKYKMIYKSDVCYHRFHQEGF